MLYYSTTSFTKVAVSKYKFFAGIIWLLLSYRFNVRNAEKKYCHALNNMSVSKIGSLSLFLLILSVSVNYFSNNGIDVKSVSEQNREISIENSSVRAFVAGVDGADGADGVKGANGADGASVKGADGADGADGQEIVREIIIP